MIKSGFSYLKLAAVVAVLAIALIPSMTTSMAESTPPALVPTVVGADLANEKRAIDKYWDDLVAYDQQSATLGKRASFVRADLDPLQRKSDDLKGRLSGVQNTIREIIRKLKAANEWDNLDTSVAALVTDPAKRAFIEQESFKRILEEGSSGLTNRANEISTPLDNLRKRLTSRYGDRTDFRIVRANYEAAAPVGFNNGLRCRVGQAKIRIIIKLGGNPTDGTFHDVFASCHDEGDFNPF